MHTNPSTLKSRQERAALKELQKQLRASESARISAEATRFAALSILEDIVNHTTAVSTIPEEPAIIGIPLSSYNRAVALVNHHRGEQ